MKNSALAAYRKAVLSTASVLAALVLLSGCGSGGGKSPVNPATTGGISSSVSRAKGSVSFTVKWPDRTRLVPVAANSILLTIQRNAKAGLPTPQVLSHLLTRPAAGQPLTTTYQFDNLELGDYVATATAFPNVDGTGIPQATGPANGSMGTTATPFTVQANKTGVTPAALRITMDSTIVNFAVLPATGTRLRANATRTFTATATDANGNLVVVNQSIAWSVSPANLFQLKVNGDTAVLSYTGPTPLAANVTATVTATDKETGKTASAVAVFAIVGLGGTTTSGGVTTITGWPKFHGNAQNTGQAPTTVTGDALLGTMVAAFNTPNGDPVVFSSPAVGADGTIYVGAYDGFLYALTRNGANFTVKWKFHTGDIIESSPAISADGTVYVGSFDGNVYALDSNQPDPNNVQPLWTFPAGGPVFASPAISSDGYVYVGGTDTDHNLYKLDGFDGSLVATFTANGGIQTAAAFTPDGGLVVVGSLDNNVYILDANTLTPVAAPFATSNQIFSSSAAIAKVGGKNVAFIGSTDGNLYAIGAQAGDAQLGKLIWNQPFPANAPIYASPAVSTDNTGTATAVYVASFDNVSMNANNSRLYRLDPTTGTQVWQFPAAGGATIGTIDSSPAIGKNGAVYFGCYDGNVYGVTPAGDSQYGTLLGAPRGVQTGDTISSSPAISQDGTIYVGSFNGRVFAIQ